MARVVFTQIPVTFAAGASVSNVVDVTNLDVDLIRTPAGWVAAALAFDETPDPGNPAASPPLPVFDDGGGDAPAELRLQVVANVSVRLRPGLFAPCKGLRLRSVALGAAATAAAAPVVQTAQAVFVLVCRQVTA